MQTFYNLWNCTVRVKPSNLIMITSLRLYLRLIFISTQSFSYILFIFLQCVVSSVYSWDVWTDSGLFSLYLYFLQNEIINTIFTFYPSITIIIIIIFIHFFFFCCSCSFFFAFYIFNTLFIFQILLYAENQKKSTCHSIGFPEA